ncbi:hypothetical protein AAC03nite_31770 [Alicyclobacillus acidoterrestris]|nr:hypothetical protein AAC03nite_31770 [Alicyclobacillus acidoterrestris]
MPVQGNAARIQQRRGETADRACLRHDTSQIAQESYLIAVPQAVWAPGLPPHAVDHDRRAGLGRRTPGAIVSY